MSDILIIGASHSGVAVAAALRSAKYDGSIMLVTDENILPYHRPPLSKEALSKDDYALTPLRPETFYASNRIDLVQAVKIVALNVAENYALSEDGRRFPYGRLILACGAEPRRLSTSVDPNGVAHTLRTHDDLIGLKARLAGAKSVAIIGGGLIGMEIAAMALAKGLDVTVIEAGSRLMERTVSKSIANYVLDRYLNQGLHVRFGAAVTTVVRDGGRGVDLVTLGDSEQIEADIVVVAIGAAPHENLARDAGLEVNNGILVSEIGRSSHPAVYAVGDCSAWYDPVLGRHVRNEAVNPGQDQAKIVAAAITGAAPPPKRLPRYWSHQAAIQIQMSGEVNGADMEAVLNAPASGAFSVLGFKRDRLVAVQTINAPQQFGKLHEMIGMDRGALAAALDVEFPPPHHH
ncbi:NAD(P)/FAD-dependent oxidoreductase [Rhizobium acaciae]|uniref:NAD(P)/FAD-dependent oxidoreductase n=1 Tax=Rhizobium acaciae TaxID=2989736 RepID=UPI003F9D98B2